MIFGTLFLFAIGTVLLLESAKDKTPFEPLVGCESNDEIQVVCGFKNPEDLVIIPDGSGLIVSEYGGQKPIQEEGVGKQDQRNAWVVERILAHTGGTLEEVEGTRRYVAPADASDHFLFFCQREYHQYLLKSLLARIAQRRESSRTLSSKVRPRIG